MTIWVKRMVSVLIFSIIFLFLVKYIFSGFWSVFRYVVSITSLVAGLILVVLYRKGFNWDEIVFKIRYYINLYLFKKELRNIELKFGEKEKRESGTVLLMGTILIVAGLFTLIN